MSDLFELLANYPEIVAFDERFAKLDAEKAEGLEAAEQAAKNWQRALEATGPTDPVPPAPELTSMSVERRHEMLRTALKKERAAWLAENFEALNAELCAREDEIIGKAMKLLTQLDELDAEHKVLHRAASHLRQEASEEPLFKLGGSAPTTTPLEMLYAAARNDHRLLREPFTTPRQRHAGTVVFSR